MKRPMRTVAMEPGFAKKSTRAFVCGGLSGALVLREKGWLGHKETTIHSGEGPIWQVRWRGTLIAWANDHVRWVLMLRARSPNNLITGSQNLRPPLADAGSVHQPACRQPTRRSLQMYASLARRLHSPHWVDELHQSCPNTHATTNKRPGSNQGPAYAR